MTDPRTRKSSLYVALLLTVAAASQLSCTGEPGPLGEDGRRVDLPHDLRVYARDARVKLTLLGPADRAKIEPLLRAHERAIVRYDRLMARGQTRRSMMAPLLGTGAYVVLNDATGVGIADDVLLPFLALGAVAVTLATRPSASNQALSSAYQDVKDSAIAVSDAMNNATANGIDQAMSESIAEPGTRQHCIDRYVDCKNNAARGFDTRKCQGCMDLCMGGDYEWPDISGCDYQRRLPRPRRRPRRSLTGPHVKI